MITELLRKKRDGLALNQAEIDEFISGCLSGEAADYQISAMLMAIYLNGMTEEEAHRYIQKCSMDSGTNLVETAEMVLSMMKF